ncbi:MAG TPA: hypothetical protein VNL16_10440 [Chloroflexota bacterium]|nr:hypothetical protein [Chloroflexota bacterium]
MYAFKLLDSDRSVEVVQAALGVIEQHLGPSTRPALLRRYEHCDADGNKRDPGGYLRSAILRVLRRVVKLEDLPLLERAAQTYEFMPPADEVCSSVRANALVAMNELDPALASYHCVRLLSGKFTAEMSGEPAVTAARILAAQSRYLPLYGYVVGAGGQVSEALSEALRSLAGMPGSLLPPIVGRYRDSDDELVLVGLFDLILGHADGAAFDDVVLHFLRTTVLHDVHRYLVTAIVANRKRALLVGLLDVAAVETDRRKQENLVEALALLHGDAAAAAAVKKLKKLSEGF